MTYQQALEYIHSLPKTGGNRGTQRIARLLERLDNPQTKFLSVHIGGTNGKGSTTAMCANILAKSGYRCGMFISPFVTDFRERIQINGQLISQEDLKNEILLVKQEIEKMEQNGEWVSEFEAVTAVAFSYFAKHCDIVCVEVGIGGAHDATNVIPVPMVSVITSVSFDHVHILGDTIQQIAKEKSGIIKQNGVCVCYPRQDIEATAVFLEACYQTNSRFIQPNPNSVHIESQTLMGSCFCYDDHFYQVTLAGEHQIYNAVTVIEAMKQLRLKGMNIPQCAVEDGIKETKLPARFEIMNLNPLVILDGAHNAEAMEKLSESLCKIKNGYCVAIVGMMQDKDAQRGLEAVCSQADEVICVSIDYPRAFSPKALSELASGFCKNVSSESNLEKAFMKAVQNAGKDGTIIICGSFYLAGEMRSIICNYLEK